MPVEITKDNFDEIVINSERPVLIDFWASWCGPCRNFGPIFDEFSQENTDVIAGKINVDENPELASKFKIMTIPTVIIFKNGQEKERSVGVISKNELEALIKK